MRGVVAPPFRVDQAWRSKGDPRRGSRQMFHVTVLAVPLTKLTRRGLRESAALLQKMPG